MSTMKSQEASASASPCSYHVFLSFRGEDTRKTFTDHLYTALDQAGFHTFRDDDGIEKGEDIKFELDKAIRESRISIIVFSKNYASSTWCLEELVMILKRRASGHIVLPIFYNVDPSEVRKQIGSFEQAFTRHEEKLKSEIDELAKEKLKDKVGTWRAALREVADVAGMNLQNQDDGDKDSTVTILDGCEFYTVVGIQNLMDRCLISIDGSNTLVMHHLLQEMGREIVRQESPKEPGKRSILWNHKDAFDVLRENTGTSEIEGLKLDMCLLKEDIYASTVFGGNRKRRYEEFLEKPLFSNLGGFFKRYSFSIFSPYLEPTDLENSNPVALEADAFAKMSKLKLLQLNRIHISGSYKKFPKRLRWLCWRGFPLKSIPDDFPLESLVALDMQYSRLKNIWDGTKFLRLLKILDLSHSYNLAKTPDVSEVPNLERLVLKSCTSLIEVHESIGHLGRLVLLDLEDCKNLRNLPRSICMLKHLETLIVSGCSNLNGLPTNMGNMESLTVLMADGIALNQSVSTNGQVNAVQSFILPWRLKPRESPEISRLSLQRSLVKLSLEKCNLSDDDFPRDLSNLCSLKELYLGFNQFRRLPDFIRGLPKLESLEIDCCPRLRKLDGVPQLCHFYFGGNRLLEEVTYQISHRPTTTCHLDACHHPEPTSAFKLESIENVEVEIVNNLGLSNLQSMGNLTVKLTSWFGMKQRGFPLQVCFETHIICAYVPASKVPPWFADGPGSKVPPWFNFKNQGSSINFIVPSYLNSRIRGLNLCSLCGHSGDPIDFEAHTVIRNRTKGLVWSHCPYVFGTAEGEDTMWLSYWKFGNHLEGGDEINISVSGGEFVQVGVRLLYEEEHEEMSSQSTDGDKIPHLQFGNIVPGTVSAHQPSTLLYQLGSHLPRCINCERLYPPPWIHTTPDDYDWTVECQASRLLMPKPFNVSQDRGC